MASTYTYKRLNHRSREIRLLKILPTIVPGKCGNDVDCTITHASLDDHPPYEALSYAWQSDAVNSTIHLNGFPFTVQPNLKAALNELCNRTSARTLWVDAICINQSDDDEKSFQVGEMRNIYKEATKVIAWIGEEADESDQALKFLNEMGNRDTGSTYSRVWDGEKFSHYHCLTFDEIRQSRWYGDKSHIRIGFPVVYESQHYQFFDKKYLREWQALDALLSRTWWSRTWVVQEIWLASKAILKCGKAEIPWKQFEKAMNFEDAWDDLGDNLSGTPREEDWDSLKRRYSLAIHIASPRLLKSTLSDLLWNCWDRESTDPRDKVYALLGLVGEKHMTRILPDYSKSVNQVYIEAFKEIVRTENTLDILLAASGPNSQEGLPSWVPNWRRSSNMNRPALFVNRQREFAMYKSGSMDSVVLTGHGFQAGKDTFPSVHFDEESGTLIAKGILIGIIDRVGEEPTDTATADEIKSNAATVAGSSNEPYLTGESRSVAIEKTLLAEQKGVRSPGERVILTVMRKRRFFVSREGYMGVGPTAAYAGDVVCILSGCNFPLILREEGEHYFLAGEAYVHGIMDGKMVAEGKMNAAAWKNFYIK